MLDFTATAGTATTPPAITAAAHAVATAQARHDAAAAALAEAEGAIAKISERIAALEQDRQAIAARRARGEHQADDGARLELARMDLEGLAGIAAEAEAEAADRRQRAEAAERILVAARGALTRAEDELTRAALTQHAARLDALMADTLQQAAAAAQRIGGAIGYVPSPALATSFRRLLAAAGRL